MEEPEITVTPADKYIAFEQRIASPNSMENMHEWLFRKRMEQMRSDMEMRFFYGWTEDQIKQYPLSQQDAFQKDK